MKLMICRTEGAGENNWYWRLCDEHNNDIIRRVDMLLKDEAFEEAKKVLHLASEGSLAIKEHADSGLSYKIVPHDVNNINGKYTFQLCNGEQTVAVGLKADTKEKISTYLFGEINILFKESKEVSYENPEHDLVGKDKKDDNTETENMSGSNINKWNLRH